MGHHRSDGAVRSWLVAEVERTRRDSPWLLNLLMWIGHHHVVILCGAAAVLGGLLSFTERAQDALLFAAAGRRLLSSGWLDTYNDPAVQVGPVHLLVEGLLARAAEAAGLPPLLVSGAGLSALAMLMWLVAVARAQSVESSEQRSDDGAERRRIAFGAGVLLLGPLAVTVISGQLVELLVAPLWLLAAVAARRGHHVTAGLIVGLSGGVKLWGLLGLPLLLITPASGRLRLRGLGLRAVSVAVVPAVAYVPFWLAGSMRMFDYEWAVKPNAPISMIIGTDTPFPWPLRVLQAVIVCLAGAAAVRWLRMQVWSAPGVLLLVRMITDPCAFVYYWAVLLTWLLAQAWCRGGRPDGADAAAVVLVPLCLLLPQRTGALIETLVMTGVLLSMVLALLLRYGRARSAD